jgi:hypothetical protein
MEASMNDWYGTAKLIISKVHDRLPAHADLATRREACLKAKPHEFSSTSWGRKVWARAQREYLGRYGYVPKTPPAPPPAPMLSPLERQKAATEAHQQNVQRIQARMAQVESEMDRVPRA